MSLSSFAVKAPVKVTMIFVGVLLLGWISLGRLSTNLFPDLATPKVTVNITANGLSPVEVERRISEVLERSLYSIRGVRSVQSISRADGAVVVAQFGWDTRMDYAVLEVKKAASDLQRDRAQDISAVSVIRYDPNARPVITAALQAPTDVDLEAVFRTADNTLRARFERIDGVANVVVTGGIQREIQVLVDESMLLAYDLQISAIISALKSDNTDGAGGWVEEGARRYLVKAQGRFQSPAEVGRVVVGRKGDATIVLSDVARVEYAPREEKSIVILNGKPAVGMAFYREAEGNTVAVAEGIRKEIEEARKILPKDWTFVVANDQSTFIADAIREVRDNALLGGILAIVVLLAFLRDIRTTLIIAIAIPVSIIATFNLMYFQGLSLNLMSLGGLALGVGMLVDNAIVVLENVFRLRSQGVDSMEAAREGTRQVAGALMASTLTTVAVFLPIAYVQGLAAMLFREQALTVSYSLLGSLLVALLLIPMLASRFLGSARGDLMSSKPTLLSRSYEAVLRLALRFRFAVLLGSLVFLFIAWEGFRTLPQEFLPATDVRQMSIRVVLPNGTPIGATDRVFETVAAQTERFAPAIESTFTRIGEAEGVVNANVEDPDGPNTGEIFLALRSNDKPTTAMLTAGLAHFTSTQLVGELKPVLDRIDGAKVTFNTSQGSLAELLGTSAAPLLIELSGPDLDILTRLASDARDRLGERTELLNLRTNLLDGNPELRLRFDKAQLARSGLDINTVASLIKGRLEGEVATRIRGEAGDVDIHVSADYGTETIDTLREMTFKTSTGNVVRVGALAEFSVERGPREIVRRRQERVALVMADLAPGVRLSDGIAAAQQALGGLTIPSRYTLRFTGEEEQRRESFGSLLFALVLSIILVYMVMASIFESFIQPLLIMATVPMAAVGVVGGLMMTGQTLNVMSIIGVVMLGGIVVNNAIVLLDCVNQIRNDTPGADLRESLVSGCVQRLRPVLMTTLTTLLGLLPMALGIGSGAELRQALAITVLGGLLSSTLLTLVVIPCGQAVLDSALRRFPKG